MGKRERVVQLKLCRRKKISNFFPFINYSFMNHDKIKTQKQMKKSKYMSEKSKKKKKQQQRQSEQ